MHVMEIISHVRKTMTTIGRVLPSPVRRLPAGGRRFMSSLFALLISAEKYFTAHSFADMNYSAEVVAAPYYTPAKGRLPFKNRGAHPRRRPLPLGVLSSCSTALF